MTDAIENFEKVAVGMEADEALAEISAAENFGGEIVGDNNALACAHFSAGANESLPGEVTGGSREEDFHPSAGAVLAMAVEAGREDFRVVEDDAIAGMNVAGEIAKVAIGPSACGAIDDEQPRTGSVGERLLSDEFFGKIEVEVGDEQISLCSWLGWDRADFGDRVFLR